MAFLTTLAIGFGMMVGSWAIASLFKPKQEQPKPEDEPLINSSLRGKTIPVIFGTVRVMSHLVWKNNFTPKKIVDKIKTGLFSSTKIISYKYKMDVLYNMGLVPKSYKLFGGWVSVTKIDDGDLTSLITSSDGDGYNQIDLSGEETFRITADEMYLYNGGDQDSDQTGWPYFWTQESVTSVRWPNTMWLGIKQLDLGANTTLPNFNWEVGPEGEVTNDAAFIGFDDTSSISNSEFPWQIQTRCDVYGQSLRAGGGFFASGHDVDLVDLNGDLIFDWFVSNLEAVAIAFIETKGFTNAEAIDIWDGESPSPSMNDWGMWIILGGQYYVAMTQNTQGFGGSRQQHNMVLLQANNGAEPTVVGYGRYEPYGGQLGFGGGNWFDGNVVDRADTDDSVDRLFLSLSYYTVNQKGLLIMQGPTINELKLGLFTEMRGVDIVHSWQDFEMPCVCLRPKDQLTLTGTDVWHDWFWEKDQAGTITAFDANYRGRSSPFFMKEGGANYAYFRVSKAVVSYYSTEPSGSDDNLLLGKLCSGKSDTDAMFRWHMAEFNSLKTPQTDNEELIEDTAVFEDVSLEWGMPWTEENTEIFSGVTYGSMYGQSPSLLVKAGDGVYNVIFNRWSRATDDFVNPEDGSASYMPHQFKIFRVTALAPQLLGSPTQYAYSSSDIGVLDGTLTGALQDYQVSMYLAPSGDLVAHSASFGDPDITRIVWDVGNLGSSGEDITPAEIIYEILTNLEFGVGFATSQINDASYNLAFNYCIDNDIFVSTQFKAKQGYLDFVELCLAVYGGYLIWSGNEIKFGIVRGDEIPIRTLDNDHFVVEPRGEGDWPDPVDIDRGALQDTFNLIRINYLDRNLAYRQNQVEIGDEVDQDLNGIRLREFPPQFVMSEKLAGKMAIRTLWSNLYARETYEFFLGWKDEDLEPGDVVTLVDSFSNLNTLARLTYKKEDSPGKSRVVALQELQYDALATLDISSASLVSAPSALPAPIEAAAVSAYELPKEFSVNPTVYVGWRPKNQVAGANLYTSNDGVNFVIHEQIPVYPDAGVLLSDLPNNRDFVDQVEIIMQPGSGYNVSSNTPLSFNDTLDLNANRQGGNTALWVGSEMIAYERISSLDQNRYLLEQVHRGWGGTHIHNHSSGDSFWFQSGGGIGEIQFTADKVGQKVHYRLYPYGFSGVEVDSVTAGEYTILGTVFRPQVLDNLNIYVGSSDGSYPEATPLPRGPVGDLWHLGATDKMNVAGARENIIVTWEDGARVAGFGTGGYGNDGTGGVGYGRFAPDVTSHKWHVEVTGSGDVVVNSSVVTTPFFSYTAAQNATDNGAFRGNVAIQVTPFNDYGDALRSAVRSLQL